MTAVLSWHVQKFIVIWWPATELWQGEVPIVFELLAKKLVIGSLGLKAQDKGSEETLSVTMHNV